MELWRFLKMNKVFVDTETCGLHGPIVLIQYAFEDGPIELHPVWTTPIEETLELIERFCECCYIGFNNVFDWFHFQQLYTTLHQFPDHSVYPEDFINEYALFEKGARDVDLCLKPAGVFDIMLHARKGPYQTTMNRDDIRIKRIPTVLARHLVAELNKRIQFKDIWFARKSDSSKRWQIYDILDSVGDIIPDLKDIVLKFAPSSALKALALDALELDNVKFFKDVGVAKVFNPVESGFAPFALAPFLDKRTKMQRHPRPGNWLGKWPDVIRYHIDHWNHSKLARQYAEDDVRYTRDLFHHFKIEDKDLNDDDSILSCMVASIRWRGYRVSIKKILDLKKEAVRKLMALKFNFNSTEICRRYMSQVMSDIEQLVLKPGGKQTTKAIILEEIAKWRHEEVCECGGQNPQCFLCAGEGYYQTEEKHPAAKRAQEILDARHAKKEIEIYDKFILAGRFHASFNIIGALSSRMSGADGLNPQGINHATYVRKCFPLAWKGTQLCGGDLAGSQVAIADAVFKDPKLHEELLTETICSDCHGIPLNGCKECKYTGKVKQKLYAIFGTYLFPGMTYQDIMQTKGLAGEQDKYDRSKKAVLAMLFGGEPYTLATRVGISQEAAEEAYKKWVDDHPKWGEERQKYFDMYCSMRQPGGVGTRVIWKDPARYVESIFGFRRYFTLENQIVRVLFELGQKPPKEWRQIKLHIVRREREQTACGALQSGCLAEAFRLQAANMRAAANHVIQSPEATIVKRLQASIWELQPAGIHPWQVAPMNIHDEIMCPTVPNQVEAVSQIVDTFIEKHRSIIPLLAIDWSQNLSSWADK